jgi:predicted nucleic acid-binding protein
MLCSDTSFLFSLYRKDAHTAAAVAYLSAAAEPLLLSGLNEYEFGNALRFAEFRGLLTAGEAARRLKAFVEDRQAGRWQYSRIPLEDILAEASEISGRYTVTGGHRALDILHVAHARLAAPKRFLSFDDNQRKLAKTAGLAVGPNLT